MPNTDNNITTEAEYFIVCGNCKHTTWGFTKAQANRDTCPRCGDTNIVIDTVEEK